MELCHRDIHIGTAETIELGTRRCVKYVDGLLELCTISLFFYDMETHSTNLHRAAPSFPKNLGIFLGRHHDFFAGIFVRAHALLLSKNLSMLPRCYKLLPFIMHKIYILSRFQKGEHL